MPLSTKTESEIRRRRIALGLSQEEAAAVVGVSYKCYGRTERVPSLASRDTITKIADGFGCKPEDLLTVAK